ncbi:MAG: hypothetical protein WBF58_07140 [Xanthobacteraceae bacterium]
MNANDNDPPADNVIPFGHVVPGAIAEELHRYYESLVCAELPEEIAALMQVLAARLAKEKQKA